MPEAKKLVEMCGLYLMTVWHLAFTSLRWPPYWTMVDFPCYFQRILNLSGFGSMEKARLLHVAVTDKVYSPLGTHFWKGIWDWQSILYIQYHVGARGGLEITNILNCHPLFFSCEEKRNWRCLLLQQSP